MIRAGVFEQHSATRTLTFSGAHRNRTLFFVLALAFSEASLFAQAPTWVDSFDKIRDPDILAKLRSYEKQGWEPVFRATGKSAAALTAEAEFEMQRLRNIIASDNDAITRATMGPAVAPTPVQCKAALSNSRDPLLPVCDKSLRQDELLAISGISKLLPAYQNSLARPEFEGHFGKSVSNEVAAKVKIRVLGPEPATARVLTTRTSGSSALLTSFADDGSTLEVHQGDNVVVQMVAKGKRVRGFVVDPVGILVLKPGLVHYDTDRMMILHAQKPGLVTISFRGPAEQSANYACSECWSGYLQPGGPFFGIKGQWQVPTIDTAFSPRGSSSTWIGIDGSKGVTPLIQIGTNQEFDSGFLGFDGGPFYLAFWQVLPQNEYEQIIGKSVNPGDWMSATIIPVAAAFPPAPNQTSSWEMTLTNITQGWTFSTEQSYNGPLNTAEWIQEDPSSCIFSCSRGTLDNYGQVTFDYGNGVATSLSEGNDPIWVSPGFTSNEQLVINQNNSVFSTPGPPSCDGDGFLVTYSSSSVGPALNQNASPGPVVNTAQLAPAQLNVPYSQTLVASDSWASPLQGNWSWALYNGSLPSGLMLNSSSGVISGTPVGNGTSLFSVVATDISTFAEAHSCPQALSINVTANAQSTLQILCGGVSPPTPVASIAVQVDGNPAFCGVLALSPGPHTVTGAVENGQAGGYKMVYGGACTQSGPSTPSSNPPAIVQLGPGQIQGCGIAAVSWSLIESGGCREGQKCCDPSPTGCKSCVPSREQCP